MRFSIIKWVLNILCLPLFGQIVITEVMFDLDGADSPREFVEILNISDMPVSLYGWTIRDIRAQDELLADDFLLPGGQFAVILESDYDGFYDNFFPEDNLLIYVDDSSIGNGLGNTSDSLYVLDEDGEVVAAMGWNAGIPSGFSLEKIHPEYPDVELNWSASRDSLGTPGRENSVSCDTIDLSLDTLFHYPAFPEPGDQVEMTAVICNDGLFETDARLSVNNNIIDSVWMISGETAQINWLETASCCGLQLISGFVIVSGDFNQENNLACDSLKIPYRGRDLIINEIMYAPVTDRPEWIELWNISEMPVNLWGWSISDVPFAESGIQETVVLEPDEFLVWCEDSLFHGSGIQFELPGLNNSGDEVYLMDLTGRLIDHVAYLSDWGGEDGFSLERICLQLDSNNPQNWASSVHLAGSTPGARNSLFSAGINDEGNLSIHPNPFSPDGDGSEDEVFLSYHLPFPQCRMTAVVYDVTGRAVRTLSAGKSMPMEGILRWDGRDQDQKTCPMGRYILKFEAVDTYTDQQFVKYRLIVLAHRM